MPESDQRKDDVRPVNHLSALLPPVPGRRSGLQRSAAAMTSTLMLSLVMMAASQSLVRLPGHYELAMADVEPGFGSARMFETVRDSLQDAVADVLVSQQDQSLTEVAITHREYLDELNAEVEALEREVATTQQALLADEREPANSQPSHNRKQVDLAAMTAASSTVTLQQDAEIDILEALGTPALQPIDPTPQARSMVRKFFGKDVDLASSRYSRFDRYFQKYASLYFGAEVDWRWFKAQAYVESGMRTSAESHAGAVGLMQIMPATWKEIQRLNGFFRGKSIDEPEWNIAAGIYYNAYLRRIWRSKVDRSEHFKLMFASYNAGVGRVERLTTDEDNFYYFAHHRLPGETRRYLKKISALMDRYTGTRLDGIDLV